MRAMIRRFIRDEEAATAIEYALIAGVMAALIAAAFGALGTGLEEVFTRLVDYIKGEIPSD